MRTSPLALAAKETVSLNVEQRRADGRAWQFEYSVDCNAPREFAWSYWTNIANWNDPPASFHLDGPFAAGSRLTTNLPGQTFHAIIRDLTLGHAATIEMELGVPHPCPADFAGQGGDFDLSSDSAILSFHWKFEGLSAHRARITQRLVLSGANANAFVTQARVLEQTAPAGMKKLSAAIEECVLLM
jgi:hypothetical protein